MPNRCSLPFECSLPFGPSSLRPLLAALVVLTTCLSLTAIPVSAQNMPSPPSEPEPPNEEEPHPWTYELGTRLSGSQAAYSNWQEGGVSAISVSALLDGEAQRTTHSLTQLYQARFRVGFINQEEEPFRKSEDVIRLQMALRYLGDDFFERFNPTFASVLRTQFAKGFNFSSDPFPDSDREPPVLVSDFLAPAFFTQSLGLTYDPASWYTLRFGGATKQTIVRNEDLRVLYDVPENNLLRFEAGAEVNNILDVRIMENVRWRSTLNIFLSFNEVETPPDVTWENTVSMRINDWLSTELEFVALYNENVTDAIQIKEVLSVGITFNLI